MARRGERIGDAYIRIHADGGRALKDVERDYAEAGDRSGRAFSQGFKKRVVEFAFGRELGNREGRSFGQSFRDVSQRMMHGTMNRFGREIFHARRFALWGRDAGRGFAFTFGKELFTLRNVGRSIGRSLSSVEDTIGGGINPNLREMRVNLERIRRVSGPVFGRMNEGLFDFSSRLRTVGGDLDVFRDRTHHYADAFGRAFGRGARNDFINFIGAFVRGTLLATAGVARLTLGAIQGFGRLGEAFTAGSAGGGFLGGLRSMGSELAAMFPRVAALATSPAGIAGLIVGFGALAVVLTSVISLFISLGGAVTALAVTIGSALVGGLTILAALLVPVTAGIGGLAAAILLMDDSTKKALRESIQPFIDQMKVLADVTADEAFKGITQDAKELGRIFKDPVFVGFARDVGIGLRQVREEFLAAFDTDRFRDFFEFMGPKVREQLLSLTEIFIQLGSGIGGLFIAATPAVDRFLSRLDGVTSRFAEFANSTAGRAALTDFFVKAEASLAAIGDLIVSVGENFAIMFRLGAGDAGIALIDSIKGKFEDFTAFMRNNPDTVRQFFGDAVAVTRAVGDALLGVISIFDALDTHTSRQGVITFFSTLADVLNFLGEVIGFVTGQFDFLGQKFSIAGAAFDFIATAVPGLNALKTGLDGVALAGDNVKTTADAINQTPIAPTFNPTFVQEAQVGYGTVLQLGTEVNNSTLFPQVQLQQVDALDARLRLIAEEAAREKVINVKAPQDPVLALIEKVNFLSLSVGALKEKGGASLKISAPGLDKTLSSVRNLSTAVSGIRPKTVSVTAPTINAVIARIAFLSAVTFRTKPLNISTNANTVLSQLASIQNFTIADKEFTVTQRNRITGPKLRTDARGAVEVDTYRYMAAGGFANFKQFYDPFTIAGESGREAIVPLDRPLGQVDPAVRELAAFAQGKFDYLLANAVGKQGINASGWTIVTPTENPAAVADEVINRITALSY